MLRDARFLNFNKLPATKKGFKKRASLQTLGSVYFVRALQNDSIQILTLFYFFYSLTCMFFFLNFLAATQDIAVDGWALTMLKRENVGYASTCNSVGQTAGYFMGYVRYTFSRIFNFLQRVLA